MALKTPRSKEPILDPKGKYLVIETTEDNDSVPVGTKLRVDGQQKDSRDYLCWVHKDQVKKDYMPCFNATNGFHHIIVSFTEQPNILGRSE